jgi:hypothetical protein
MVGNSIGEMMGRQESRREGWATNDGQPLTGLKQDAKVKFLQLSQFLPDSVASLLYRGRLARVIFIENCSCQK